MIFKTTLLMSNPQIIRVFELDAEGAVKTIIRAVEAVHDWSVDSGLTIWRNGKVISNTNDVTIRELLAEETKEDLWELRLEGGAMRYLDREEQWVFRLEVDSYQQNVSKDALPRLLRYRGLNPDYTLGAVRTWNQYAKRLANEGNVYQYGKGYIGQEAYMVNPANIKTKLQRAVRTDLKQVQITYKFVLPLETMMEYHTVNEMKAMIVDNELGLEIYQRKANLVADLTEYYDDPDFWIMVLEEMSLPEYETFSRCVQKNEKLTDNNYTLIKYGITFDSRSPYKGYLPSEFLSFYEDYMMEEGDEELLETKKTEEVLTCARALYGVFNISSLCKLANVMYPELGAEYMMGIEWDNFILGLMTSEVKAADKELGKTEIIFNILDVTEPNAKMYWNAMTGAKITQYIPSKKEAFAIAREGLSFSEKADLNLQRLIRPLKGRYGYYKDELVVADIYNMCHMNYKISEIVNILIRKYHMEKQVGKYTDLKKAIQEYKGEVRQIMFGGHTGEEARKLFHLEIKEEI